jgi:hypothetical protein
MTAVVRLFDVMAAIVSFASSVHQQPSSPVEGYGTCGHHRARHLKHRFWASIASRS